MVHIAMKDGTASTSDRGRPRDIRLDDAILSATLELLGERGFAGLSVVAVADRAGTTTPAIYRRWPSKTDLIMHAVFRTDGDDVIADTGDLESDVRTMIRWTFEKLGSPQGRAALAGLLAEPLAAGERNSQLSSLWSRQATYLASLREREEVRPDLDPTLFIAVLVGPALLASAVLGAPTDDEWVNRLGDMVLEGIRKPAGANATPKRGT
jgi:AcrR family transcriptional regulator